jgi:Cu/Ag efflux protein CusF
MRYVTMVSCLLVSAVLASGVCAAVVQHRAMHAAMPTSDLASVAPVEAVPLAAGRVVAIDPGNGKITVEHAPITRFYLERMTRTFPVEDRTLLVGHTPGDKIRFDLERRTGHYVITRIENSN